MEEMEEIYKEETIQKTIRMPESLVREIEKKANQNNRNFSNQVIQLLKTYLELTKEK